MKQKTISLQLAPSQFETLKECLRILQDLCNAIDIINESSIGILFDIDIDKRKEKELFIQVFLELSKEIEKDINNNKK